MGAREAPWRVRTAVPKALRDDIAIIPDTGPDSWRRPARAGGGRPARHPRRRRRPRRRAGDGRRACGGGAAQPRGRRAPGSGPRRGRARRRSSASRGSRRSAPCWPTRTGAPRSGTRRSPRAPPGTRSPRRSSTPTPMRVGRHERGTAPSEARVIADLRIRPAAGDDPARLAAACWDAGLDVVAIASPDGVEVASAIAAAAPAAADRDPRPGDRQRRRHRRRAVSRPGRPDRAWLRRDRRSHPRPGRRGAHPASGDGRDAVRGRAARPTPRAWTASSLPIPPAGPRSGRCCAPRASSGW